MVTLASLSLSNSISLSHCSRKHNPWHHPTSFPLSGYVKTIDFSLLISQNLEKKTNNRHRKLSVMAVTEGGSAKKSRKSKEEEEQQQTIPSWAAPDSEEPPPWARDEAAQKSSSGFEVPFFVYLLASTVTAIAAIGSVFEYLNQRPVFGVLNSDSVFYAPLLGFFAFTGIPASAFLWFKSVQAANKDAEEQDRRDGYL